MNKLILIPLAALLGLAGLMLVAAGREPNPESYSIPVEGSPIYIERQIDEVAP